jgi:hypothetical protein
VRHRRSGSALPCRSTAAHPGVPRVARGRARRVGARAGHTICVSSGAPAVRVATTALTFGARGEPGRPFCFDRHRGDAPVRAQGPGATPRARQAPARSCAASPPRPRPEPARRQSPTAAPAPPQSAAGLLRTRFHKNPGRALRPRPPMVSSIHPPSLVARNMIPSSNRSTRDLSHKKHERMRH